MEVIYMKGLTDMIVGLLFWSFMYFSAVETYQFFRDAARAQIHRGLSSTVKFTDALLDGSSQIKSGGKPKKK